MSLQEAAEFSCSIEKLNRFGNDDAPDDIAFVYLTKKKAEYYKRRFDDVDGYEPVQVVPQDEDDRDVPKDSNGCDSGGGFNFNFGVPNISIPNFSIDTNQLCGVGICKPKWAQKFANLTLFAIAYGVAGIWTITLGTLLASQITSIERHLGLTTTHTGLIMSSNDVGYLLAVMVGSHVGKYLHIPRTLSISGVLFGLFSACIAMGKWSPIRADRTVTGSSTNGSFSQSSSHLCIEREEPASIFDIVSLDMQSAKSMLNSSLGASVNGIESAPEEAANPLRSWAFWLIVVSAACGGAVKSYRFPLFTHYVESNIRESSSSSFVIGVSFTTMVFGPPIALIIGAFASSLPVDLEETTLSRSDPNWVGAWWLGFIIVGVACVLLSLPVGLFPRYMIPPTKQESGAKKSEGKKTSLGAKEIFSELPQSLRRILSQPIFLLTLIAGCIEAFNSSGAYAFSQKYIENQYDKTAKEVSMTLGSMALFSLAIGTFLGGVLAAKLKLGLRGGVFATALRSGTLLVLQFLYFYFGCSNLPYVGPHNAPTLPCDCDSHTPLLVCGDDGVNYFSPCYAGCSSGDQGEFANCSALSSGQFANTGSCESNCSFFIYYVSLYFCLIFISCMGFVPGYIIIIRSVEKADQSLAMGIIAFFQTLLGTLPSAVVFGKLIDGTCDLWSPSGGYCLLYNRDNFRMRFKGLNQALRISHMVVILTLMWLVLKRNRQAAKETARAELKKKKMEEIARVNGLDEKQVTSLLDPNRETVV